MIAILHKFIENYHIRAPLTICTQRLEPFDENIDYRTAQGQLRLRSEAPKDGAGVPS